MTCSVVDDPGLMSMLRIIEMQCRTPEGSACVAQNNWIPHRAQLFL